MTMERGFMPLNAIMFEINDALRKSKNLSPFTVSVVRSSAIIPVEHVAVMALTLLPLKSLTTVGYLLGVFLGY